MMGMNNRASDVWGGGAGGAVQGLRIVLWVVSVETVVSRQMDYFTKAVEGRAVDDP